MKVRGKLTFLEWHLPWMVGNVDVRTVFWEVAESLRGAPATHDHALNSFTLRKDESSDFDLKYETKGCGIALFKRDQFGMSNVGVYVEHALCRLNGREVEVDATDEEFMIRSDENDPVFGLYWTRDNMCAVAEPDVDAHCRPGSSDTCIFLTVSATNGFECAKFDGPTCRLLLHRKAEGKLVAGRIGDCKILGRVKNETPERL